MYKAALVIALLLVNTMQSPAQGTNQEKITFHVTGVRQEDATDLCTAGKCSATRFTVVGYSQSPDAKPLVEYILECVEYIQTEPPPAHLTTICQKVHASTVYTAWLGSDYIYFGETPVAGQDKEPYLSAYGIKSEKEVAHPRPK